MKEIRGRQKKTEIEGRQGKRSKEEIRRKDKRKRSKEKIGDKDLIKRSVIEFGRRQKNGGREKEKEIRRKIK